MEESSVVMKVAVPKGQHDNIVCALRMIEWRRARGESRCAAAQGAYKAPRPPHTPPPPPHPRPPPHPPPPTGTQSADETKPAIADERMTRAAPNTLHVGASANRRG